MYPVPVMPVLFCTAVAELRGCADPDDCSVGLPTGNTLNPDRDGSVSHLPSKLKNYAFFANLRYHSNLNQCLFGGRGQFFLRSFPSRY